MLLKSQLPRNRGGGVWGGGGDTLEREKRDSISQAAWSLCLNIREEWNDSIRRPKLQRKRLGYQLRHTTSAAFSYVNF